MSNGEIFRIVAIGGGVIGLAAFVALVMVPVVSAYQRGWERVVAGLLSLWVLAAFVGVGIVVGLELFLNWPIF
jgi:hypothetical protein